MYVLIYPDLRLCYSHGFLPSHTRESLMPSDSLHGGRLTSHSAAHCGHVKVSLPFAASFAKIEENRITSLIRWGNSHCWPHLKLRNKRGISLSDPVSISQASTNYSSGNLQVPPEAYWVPPNLLTVGGWDPYPLMLGGWDQPIICTFLSKTAYQNIFLISSDVKKAYCAKTSSLRCYSMVPYPLISRWPITLAKILRHSDR